MSFSGEIEDGCQECQEEECYEEEISEEEKPIELNIEYDKHWGKLDENYRNWINQQIEQVKYIRNNRYTNDNYRTITSINCIYCNCCEDCHNSIRLFYCNNCIDCEECQFCYDCQGLKGKKFYRNNKPYSPTQQEFDVYFMNKYYDEEYCKSFIKEFGYYSNKDLQQHYEYFRCEDLCYNLYELVRRQFDDVVKEQQYIEKIERTKKKYQQIKNENQQVKDDNNQLRNKVQQLEYLVQQYQNLYPLSFQQ